MNSKTECKDFSVTFERFPLLCKLYVEAHKIVGPEDAEDLIQKIIKSFGGNQVYIPSLAYIKRLNRNIEICQFFNGQNLDATIDRFNLCRSSIYKIVKQRKKWLQSMPLSA